MTPTSPPSTQRPPLIDRLRALHLPPPAERRAIRVAAGVTQRQMAEELGVTQLTISYWERGVCGPRAEHAIAYRQLLDQLADLVRELSPSPQQ